MKHFEDFCLIPSLHGENGMFCKSGKRSVSDFKISMWNDVIPGVLRIERMKSSISSFSVAFLVCMVKMVCFARVGKKFCRFQDVHVERCNSRITTDRTHEMEHFEVFCRIPSLHGENGMFCKSGKRSFGNFKMSMLNDVIPGVLRIERMKWSISRISVAFLVCMVKTVCFARVGKGVVQISKCPC